MISFVARGQLLRRWRSRLAWFDIALFSASLVGESFLGVSAVWGSVLIAGSLGPGCLRMVDWFHRNNLIPTLLMVAIGNSHEHDIFINLEFSFLSDGENARMLIERPDVILHVIAAKHVLWT